MRLGQLARKLSLRQAEIVAFLESNQIHIDDGSNTKVEDNHVALVLAHFTTSDTTQSVTTPTISEETSSLESVEEEVYQPETETGFSNITHQIKETKPVEELEVEILDTESKFREEESEDIIRAPKVELPGLKVIGKIEIAEPKKKAIAIQEETLLTEQQPVKPDVERKPAKENLRSVNNRYAERQDRKPRPNPIALKREREALDAEQKRKEEIEKQKEKRTQRYLKKVKIAPPTKAAKLMDEPLEDLSSLVVEKPKTIWGKFVKWLKT